MQPDSEGLLEFWFGAARHDPAAAAERNRLWFGADAAFDRELRERFGELWRCALGGALDDWAETPRGRLALILLLDQLSRNLARGTAAAFGQDGRAAELVLQALAEREEAALAPLERGFLLLPLQHAEEPALQERSVAEYRRLLAESPVEWQPLLAEMLAFAEEHRAIVLRFGRFPHRNRSLGRQSTAAEESYLRGGAPRYGQ